jgi:hypothetical protein
MALIGVERPRRLALFLRNLLEMTNATMVGMVVSALVFAALLVPLG